MYDNEPERKLVLAVINAYHKTRLADCDLASFLLDNWNVKQALEELHGVWQSQ